MARRRAGRLRRGTWRHRPDGPPRVAGPPRDIHHSHNARRSLTNAGIPLFFELSLTKDWLPPIIGQAPGLQGFVYGAVLIAFVLFEPLGLYGRWLKVRTYLQLFPFYRKGLFKRQKSFQKSDRLR